MDVRSMYYPSSTSSRGALADERELAAVPQQAELADVHAVQPHLAPTPVIARGSWARGQCTPGPRIGAGHEQQHMHALGGSDITNRMSVAGAARTAPPLTS